MKSIWENEIARPSFEALNGDIKTDVLIIGGGLAGILCGYMLNEAGIDCVIAEAKRICTGVTENTTAKITMHHGAIFDRMISRYGVERAALYLKAHREAVQKYKELSELIDCDYETADSYVYSIDDRAKIEREVNALNRLNCKAEFTRETELPFSVLGAVRVSNQAKFNPLKFAYKLAERLRIFENTTVFKLNSNCAITSRGKIEAKKIIVATHFPFINKHGFYFLKMYQHRSYVLALQNTPLMRGMYVDEDEKGLSFRQYKDYLLLGGGGHRTGKSGGGWPGLREAAAKYYPNAKEKLHYATQDCLTLDDIAYIGPYSKALPSLYVATGFNKWGMTASMVSARILANLIQGKTNEYSEVFSPSRSIWHKQLLINMGESAIGLLTPATPRCSHLGCALKYNRQEHSWDCACHGSRFANDGRIINNPAIESINVKNNSSRQINHNN